MLGEHCTLYYDLLVAVYLVSDRIVWSSEFFCPLIYVFFLQLVDTFGCT